MVLSEIRLKSPMRLRHECIQKLCCCNSLSMILPRTGLVNLCQWGRSRDKKGQNIDIDYSRLIVFSAFLAICAGNSPVPGEFSAQRPVTRSFNGVSNHQSHDCLLKRLFRRRSKKTPKLRVTGLCAGNSPVTGEFPHKEPVTRETFSSDDIIMNG